MTKNVFMPIGTSIYNISLLQASLLEAESTAQEGVLKLSVITTAGVVQCEMAITHPELLDILNADLPCKN